MSTRKMKMGEKTQTFGEDGGTMSTQETSIRERIRTSPADDDFDVDIILNIRPAEVTGDAHAVTHSPSLTCDDSCPLTCSCIDC